jgi:protease I
MVKKAIILTWDGFQDQELIYPYYRLLEEGFEVRIYSDENEVKGLFGIRFLSEPIKHLEIVDRLSTDWVPFVKESTILVIPGGVKALEKLRQSKLAIELIQYFNSKKEIISSTCHGAQMLISAKIVKGKEISGYYSIQVDIENAGAKYVDAPSVVSGNIISSPHYKHMGPWMKATLDQWLMTRIKP